MLDDVAETEVRAFQKPFEFFVLVAASSTLDKCDSSDPAYWIGASEPLLEDGVAAARSSAITVVIVLIG